MQSDVARDIRGGVIITIEHADGPPTIVSANSTRSSRVLRVADRACATVPLPRAGDYPPRQNGATDD
jgi:hypothetical protein